VTGWHAEVMVIAIVATGIGAGGTVAGGTRDAIDAVGTTDVIGAVGAMDVIGADADIPCKNPKPEQYGLG
jgi:hypothetical protein